MVHCLLGDSDLFYPLEVTFTTFERVTGHLSLPERSPAEIDR